jgi:type I restriction enzyme S subunit
MVSEFDRRRLDAYSLRTGDIVFSRVGSVDRNSIVDKSEEGWLFSGRLLRIRVTSKHALPKYLSYHFQQESFKQRIRSVAVGQTMASLNTQILKGINIALPPTEREQTAIATALSDADALISTLEKLIEKKRRIKTGVMQELLKPKKGWVVKRLGKIGRFSKGQGIKKDDSLSGEIPCIRYGELYTRHHNYIKKYYSFISQDIANTSVRLRQGDILFAGSGETKDEIGKCAAFVGSDAVYAGSDIVILSPLNANSIFLGFVLNSKFVVDQKANRGQGDAVVHISGAQLQEVLIPYPTLDKQAEIAATLLEIDSELMVLTSKLDKYKKIKQGMMQNLLTGKIRLI